MPKPVRSVSRNLLRMARRIHDQAWDARHPVVDPLPESDWRRLRQCCRRLELARERGWHVVRTELGRNYRWLARGVVQQLETNVRALDEAADRRPIASLGDILADLRALESEFENFAIDLRAGTVSVTTDPIILEGITLGPFQIVVAVERLGEPSPYDLVALDPNPAAGSSEFVHPHVQDEILCEGEGKAAIRRASEQGRIHDLCVIVRQILRTYHAGSAYLPLSQWDGRECHDCGRRAGDDETTRCGRCDHDLCFDCSVRCPGCRDDVCAGCRTSCSTCAASPCDGCIRGCAECGLSFCAECLDGRLCDDCQPSVENPDDQTTDESDEETATTADGASEAGAAVHAVGVGQVPVPA